MSVEIEYQLQEYARNRDVGGIENCLKLGADPNFRDLRKGGCARTALHKVFMKKIKTPAERFDVDRIVKLLLDAGADFTLVDKGSYKKYDPLMWALDMNVLGSIQLLIGAGAKMTNQHFKTFFWRNFRRGFGNANETTDWLIQHGEKELEQVEKKKIEGKKVEGMVGEKGGGRAVDLDLMLRIACQCGFHQVVKKLLKKTEPTDVIWNDLFGYRSSNSWETAVILVEDGRLDPSYGNNSLLMRVCNYYYQFTPVLKKILELLIADPRVDCSFNHNQVLRTSCHANHSYNEPIPKKVKVLLKDPQVLAEVKSGSQDPDTGDSPVHLLLERCRYGSKFGEHRTQALRMLIDAGMPCNLENKKGDTPLRMALRYKGVPQEVVDMIRQACGEKIEEKKPIKDSRLARLEESRNRLAEMGIYVGKK